MTTPIQRGKLLRISSEDAEGKSSNGADFTVNLNSAPYVQRVRGLVVKSVSFKHVFPNIFEGNRTFTYIYDGVQQSVQLPVAWYDINSFPQALAAAITALAGDPVTVVATVSPAGASTQNKRLVFTASVGHTIGLLDSSVNAMALIVGISANVPEALSVEAQWLYDLGGLTQVYLECGEIAGANSTVSSNQGEAQPVVCEIPIDQPFGSQVFYASKDADLDSIIYPADRSLTRMAFKLRTRAGNVLDLAQHQLVVVFKIIPSEFFATA